jgi:bifunctional DNA-binding transcriptional regulator/antitoxin component of YhaV-PrlF toxin-antitoxin module
LGLRPGDALDATVDGDRVILTPCRQHVSKAKIIPHPISGHPVLSAGENAPALTSREVEEFLAEFP